VARVGFGNGGERMLLLEEHMARRWPWLRSLEAMAETSEDGENGKSFLDGMRVECCCPRPDLWRSGLLKLCFHLMEIYCV
jgi:hypothetical protein